MILSHACTLHGIRTTHVHAFHTLTAHTHMIMDVGHFTPPLPLPSLSYLLIHIPSLLHAHTQLRNVMFFERLKNVWRCEHIALHGTTGASSAHRKAETMFSGQFKAC